MDLLRKEAEMRNQPKKYVFGSKSSVCTGLGLFMLIILTAGCATSPVEEEGPYLTIRGGQNSGGVTWSK